jgi:hypothetical protein
MDAFNSIYCDAPAWLRQRTVDYLTPQMYWAIGGPQDYAALVSWWADSVARYGRDLFPGMAPYRMTSSTNQFSESEIPRQMRLNRAESAVHGEVFFRARNGITDNPKGFADSLRSTFYRLPAIPPAMPWKDAVPPYPPQALIYDSTWASGSPVLRWQTPAEASDGEPPRRYVVYRFDLYPFGSAFDNPASILGITADTSFALPAVSGGPAPSYYAVTALDRTWNESDSSNIVRFPGFVTGVSDDAGTVTAEFKLSQNFPNPFNPTTTIRYTIAGAAGNALPGQAGGTEVSLRVYDLLGREVAVLADGVQQPGEYSVRFEGRHLPSGVYYYRLTAGGFGETRRMLLVR